LTGPPQALKFDMGDEEKHKHEGHHHHHDDEVAVSVITPSGIYPDGEDYHKAEGNEKIKHVLELAAKKLEITDTKDWVVFVKEHGKDREVHPDRTFHEEHLKGIVELDWHLREGGGGA